MKMFEIYCHENLKCSYRINQLFQKSVFLDTYFYIPKILKMKIKLVQMAYSSFVTIQLLTQPALLYSSLHGNSELQHSVNFQSWNSWMEWLNQGKCAASITHGQCNPVSETGMYGETALVLGIHNHIVLSGFRGFLESSISCLPLHKCICYLCARCLVTEKGEAVLSATCLGCVFQLFAIELLRQVKARMSVCSLEYLGFLCLMKM